MMRYSLSLLLALAASAAAAPHATQCQGKLKVPARSLSHTARTIHAVVPGAPPRLRSSLGPQFRGAPGSHFTRALTRCAPPVCMA